jgi:NitT/TauT family transport system substrate-binding protein
VPETYLLGDRAVYIDAFLASKGALSADGMIPAEGAATALRALQSVDDSLKGGRFDIAAVWTNDFAKRANAKKA